MFLPVFPCSLESHVLYSLNFVELQEEFVVHAHRGLFLLTAVFSGKCIMHEKLL